jgi:hypothetical protein
LHLRADDASRSSRLSRRSGLGVFTLHEHGDSYFLLFELLVELMLEHTLVNDSGAGVLRSLSRSFTSSGIPFHVVGLRSADHREFAARAFSFEAYNRLLVSNIDNSLVANEFSSLNFNRLDVRADHASSFRSRFLSNSEHSDLEILNCFLLATIRYLSELALNPSGLGGKKKTVKDFKITMLAVG